MRPDTYIFAIAQKSPKRSKERTTSGFCCHARKVKLSIIPISDDKIELWETSLNQYSLFASGDKPEKLIVEGNRLTTRWFCEMIVWDIEKKKRVLEFPGTIGRKDFENVSNTLLVAYSLPLQMQTFVISKMQKISTERTVLFNENGLVVTGFPDRHVTIYDFTQPLPPKRWWNKLGL